MGKAFNRLTSWRENSAKAKKDGRSEFQKDFDRIVFSPAFRRLQDKTQVFPLPESDFVHTRLTHSLEVSCVGRSLGNLVGETVIKRNPTLNKRFYKISFWGNCCRRLSCSRYWKSSVRSFR